MIPAHHFRSPKHRDAAEGLHRKLFWLRLALWVNVACVVVWLAFIALTQLSHAVLDLSSQTWWVSTISYYANAMGHVSSASGIVSAIAATSAALAALRVVDQHDSPMK